MEILETNAMEELANKVQLCAYPFQTHCSITVFHSCLDLGWCRSLFCRLPFWCNGPLRILSDGLKACSSAFYIKCPGFERIDQYWPEFDPAIEAVKFKEQAQLDRIARLEAQVKELELKRKG